MVFYFQPYHVHISLLNIKISPSAYFSLLENLLLTTCHEFFTLVWLISLPNPMFYFHYHSHFFMTLIIIHALYPTLKFSSATVNYCRNTRMPCHRRWSFQCLWQLERRILLHRDPRFHEKEVRRLVTTQIQSQKELITYQFWTYDMTRLTRDNLDLEKDPCEYWHFVFEIYGTYLLAWNSPIPFPPKTP